MKILDIQKMPTFVTGQLMMQSGIVYESELRAYQILHRVKEMLSGNISSPAILELIEIMETSPNELQK